MTVSTSALGRSQDGWPGSFKRPMESIGSWKGPSHHQLPCPCGSDFRSSRLRGRHGVATICLPSARKTASAERDLVVFIGSEAAARFRHSLLGGGEVTEIVPAVIGSDVVFAGASQTRRRQVRASLAMHAGTVSSPSLIGEVPHARKPTPDGPWIEDPKRDVGVGEHGQDVSRKWMPSTGPAP